MFLLLFDNKFRKHRNSYFDVVFMLSFEVVLVFVVRTLKDNFLHIFYIYQIKLHILLIIILRKNLQKHIYPLVGDVVYGIFVESLVVIVWTLKKENKYL